MYSLASRKSDDQFARQRKWRSAVRHSIGNLRRTSFLRKLALAILIVACAGTTGAQRNSQITDVQIVTLLDGGFYPSKITHAAGVRFLLFVVNRAHTNQMQLGMTRNSDGSVALAQELVTDWNRSYVLNLTADTYVFKEWSHPNWTPLTIVTQ